MAADVWNKCLGDFKGLEACQRMCRAGSCKWVCCECVGQLFLDVVNQIAIHQ